MNSAITDIYKGWAVSVTAGKNMCSNYSFAITSPSGHCQHVALGGDSEERALDRAREMIDMELALSSEE